MFVKIRKIKKAIACFALICVIIPNYTTNARDSFNQSSNQTKNLFINQSFLINKFDIDSAAPTDPKPELPDSFLSANQHFMIYYTTDGKDAVSNLDENSNQVPDRIEKIAAAFERSYEVEIGEMNYRIPPSMDNGTKPYQIYVMDLNNSFGRTVRFNADSTAWEEKNVASYILFDNDFIGQSFHFSGDDAIKATAAHEFFHAIQLGYVFRKIDSFFFELSAVWMEDQVFDEIDNYLYYLDYFFSAPEIPLNGVSFTIPNVIKHIYGDCIFAFFLVEKFGEDIIRQIWERMPEKPAVEALDQLLKAKNTNFKKEFVKFSMWNYFTGERARPEFSYDFGSLYPEITLSDSTFIEYYYEASNSGYFLTSAYYVLRPYENGVYNIYFSTEVKEHWKLGLIVWDDKTIRTKILKPGQEIQLDEVTNAQEIVAIACNTNHLKDPTTIYFKEEPETYSVYFTREIDRKPEIVKSYQIRNIAPNPFSHRFKISLKKLDEACLSIKLFNIKGQLIANIFDGQLNQQMTDIFWSATSDQIMLSSGIYLISFSDDHSREVRKILFIK